MTEPLNNIFEPFTRQKDSVTNRVQGTGLGMAITKNDVRRTDKERTSSFVDLKE